MSREDIFNPIGGLAYVGASAFVGITAIPGQNQLHIKGISGTVYIGGDNMLNFGSTLVGGGSTLVPGYQIAAGEVFSWPLCSTTYLLASGSTATISYIIGRSQGY